MVDELEVTDWEIKPFPPGHVAQYDILPTGKLDLVSLEQFFKIEAPILPPVLLEKGMYSIVI